MFLVNKLGHHNLSLLLYQTWGVSPVDLVSVGEPNSAVVVLSKLTSHFEDLNIVHFLDEVAHLEALLAAVLHLVSLD